MKMPETGVRGQTSPLPGGHAFDRRRSGWTQGGSMVSACLRVAPRLPAHNRLGVISSLSCRMVPALSAGSVRCSDAPLRPLWTSLGLAARVRYSCCGGTSTKASTPLTSVPVKGVSSSVMQGQGLQQPERTLDVARTNTLVSGTNVLSPSHRQTPYTLEKDGV